MRPPMASISTLTLFGLMKACQSSVNRMILTTSTTAKWKASRDRRGRGEGAAGSVFMTQTRRVAVIQGGNS